MALYTAQAFKQRMFTDLWVLKEILRVPETPFVSLPSTYDEQTDTTTNYMVGIDDLTLPARQESVIAYRNALSPIIFTLTQKVYAEFFQVFLGQNNCVRLCGSINTSCNIFPCLSR